MTATSKLLEELERAQSSESYVEGDPLTLLTLLEGKKRPLKTIMSLASVSHVVLFPRFTLRVVYISHPSANSTC